LNFYPYDRWAVDVRRAITGAVLQNMQSGGFFQSVHPFDGRDFSDYLLTGTLDDLEEVDQGHDVFVQVRLSAQLIDQRTGEVIWRDTSAETSKVTHHAVQNVVAELSQDAKSAVDHLVSSMQSRVQSVSASLKPGGVGLR
jgi:ABC-type uncharacterized transport system auxiliary subunit